jgi:uroporphyrinogen-III decarboxylase
LKDPSELKTLKKLELDNEILLTFLDALYGARVNLKGEVCLVGGCHSAFSQLVYLVETNKKAKMFDKIKKWIYGCQEKTEFLLEVNFSLL